MPSSERPRDRQSTGTIPERPRDAEARARATPRSTRGAALLRQWDSLQLTTQFRVVAGLSVLSALALASVAMALWEVRLARAHVLEHVDELEERVTEALSLSSSGVEPALLRSLVANPAVLRAELASADGEVISAAQADADAATTPAREDLWLRIKRALWLAPIDIERSLQAPAGAPRTLRITIDSGASWQRVASHLSAIPAVTLIGCFLALFTARMFNRRVTDPLARLAVATRGGQWQSSEQQAGAAASVDAVGEIIDNFEAMRERLAEAERLVSQTRRDAELEIARRTADLAARAEAAERASAGMGDFLANMSHEIRTPMNGVVGMAELLSRTSLDERQQRFLRSMRAASDSMVKIINDILDVTKMDSGNMEFVPEPCNLRDLIEEVGQLYAGRAQMKGIELVCYIEPSLPEVVSADVLRLRQVLGNLLSNAVKYTERGEIVLRASGGETRNGRHFAYFEISDTGPGIEPDQQAMIFEPYKQLTNASAQSGTGLGLPIALRLVKLMGGSGIDVHSTPGHGSRFVFSLPCEMLEARRKSSPPLAIKGMRVLVVDDNATSYLFLEDTIATWGAEVTVLSHGKLLRDRLRTALQERAPFDAIVLDHSLPDVSLKEMLSTIRCDPQFRETHVILLSALEFEPAASDGITLVPDICITKPVRLQQLADALELARIPRHTARMRAGTIEPKNERATPDGIAGLRVLVVDDNAINREVAAAMLEERGCRVALAGGGSDAVAQSSAAAFDLILMDCQMPGLDGYAATENIRREEREDGRPATLVVALTANVMPRDRERCLEAGMDDILLKPFTGDQLDAVLMLAVAHAGNRTDEPEPVAESTADAFQQTLAGGLVPDFDLFESPEPQMLVASDESILDREQIEAILALRKPRLLEQLCGMLRERAPTALQEIDAALACGDLVTVRATSHELRSPVGTLGGRRFAALLSHCENAAAEYRLEAARSYGSHLRVAYASLDQALDALLARYASSRTGT